MKKVEPGSVKYVRVIESPPKQTWVQPAWGWTRPTGSWNELAWI